MNANNMDVNNSLICAVREGELERTRELINSYGLSYSQAWSEGYVLLCDALQNKHTAVAKLLLSSGALVNSEDTYTPLHFACKNGDIEIVKMLLDKGANVNVENMCGRTPLHIAIENMRMKIFEILKQRYVKDYDGTNPRYVAVEIECLQIVEDLLNYGADVNCVCTGSWKKGYTPLLLSLETGSKKVVTLLLSRGAHVDVKGEDGTTPLHIAAEEGYIHIVEDLLKHGACTHSFTLEERYTPLHFASELGNEEAVKLLLMRGADNASYNATSEEGFTPLHSAASKQEEVAKLLISCEADINAQDTHGTTPIFYAIRNADLKMINLLLTNGASIKDSPDLLNIAVMKECIEIVETLLQHDADVNAIDEYGRTALHYTASSEFKSLFGLSTNECPDLNIKVEIAKLLLSKGASVDAQTKTGVTALHAAIEKGYVQVVEALLKYNANVNSGVESGDNTPLHLCAQRGNEDICTMLLNKGANVNAKQKDGPTALHCATDMGHKEVVKVLLEHGANVDSKMQSGLTPLHLGAKKGYQEIIETILKFGADIDARDVYGRTALHIASRKGHKEVVVTLLEYGSDINITCRNGCTPLDHAMADDGDGDFFNFFSHEATAEALQRQIVKMKTANIYVSEQNLQSMSSCGILSGFQDECEEEIARMKNEKINNQNISFYDILAKVSSSLAIYMRNDNIVQVLKSGDYNIFFPIYASMIKIHFRKARKAMERKKLLEQGNKMFHCLLNSFPFAILPFDCVEKLFNYLSNEDLRTLMDACKPLSISSPNNINDAVITSSIPQVKEE